MRSAADVLGLSIFPTEQGELMKVKECGALRAGRVASGRKGRLQADYRSVVRHRPTPDRLHASLSFIPVHGSGASHGKSFVGASIG